MKRLGDRRVIVRRQVPAKSVGSIDGIPLHRRSSPLVITSSLRDSEERRGTGRPPREGPENRRAGKERIQSFDGNRFVIVPGSLRLKHPQPEFARVFIPQVRKRGKLVRGKTIKQAFIDRRTKQRRATDKPGK